MYHKVNVEGTKCVIEACQKSGVKALVYTSSASVVSDNVSDLINADERWPVIPPSAQTEYYSQTKVSFPCFSRFSQPFSQLTNIPTQAEAEALVLAANRASTSPKLLTTALRPSGIFGPGDVQVLPPMIRVYYEGKTHFQLGDNSNLFDFTYVENVAHAHILAAAALLTTSSLNTQVLDHEKVDGETFFITNDSPVPFWDFARLIWRTLDLSPSSRNINKEGKREVRGTEGNWVIGKEIGLVLGTVLEWGMWLVGRKSRLTAREVKYSCMTRYYDIGKANKRLGYVPIVGLEEGVKRGVAWFEEREREEKEKVGTGLGEKKGL